MQKKIKDDIIPIICELHIKGYSTPQISRELLAKGVSIARNSIYEWLHTPRNQPYLDKARVAYRNNPEAVDIAHKRQRLEDLNVARDAILKTLRTFITKDGTIYDKKIGRFTTLAKRLAELNIAARDEMEKKPEMVGKRVVGIFTEVSSEELRSELADINRELGVKSEGVSGEAPDTLKAGTQAS